MTSFFNKCGIARGGLAFIFQNLFPPWAVSTYF